MRRLLRRRLHAAWLNFDIDVLARFVAAFGGFVFFREARLARSLTLGAGLRLRRLAHALGHGGGINAQRRLHRFAVRHGRAEVRTVALRLALLVPLLPDWRGDRINRLRHRAIMPHRA